jgi:hypothetical protein
MTHFDAAEQGLVGCYLECAEACPSSIEHRDVPKRDQTGIHHNSASRDPKPSLDRMTAGSGPKIKPKMGQRSQSSHAATNAQKRRGEETGEAEGAEGSRDGGVEIRERELKLRWGAHDRRYKVDEVLFSTGQSANSSTPQNVSFLLSMAELGKVSPRSRSNFQLLNAPFEPGVAEQRRHPVSAVFGWSFVPQTSQRHLSSNPKRRDYMRGR